MAAAEQACWASSTRDADHTTWATFSHKPSETRHPRSVQNPEMQHCSLRSKRVSSWEEAHFLYWRVRPGPSCRHCCSCCRYRFQRRKKRVSRACGTATHFSSGGGLNELLCLWNILGCTSPVKPVGARAMTPFWPSGLTRVGRRALASCMLWIDFLGRNKIILEHDLDNCPSNTAWTKVEVEVEDQRQPQPQDLTFWNQPVQQTYASSILLTGYQVCHLTGKWTCALSTFKIRTTELDRAPLLRHRASWNTFIWVAYTWQTWLYPDRSQEDQEPCNWPFIVQSPEIFAFMDLLTKP